MPNILVIDDQARSERSHFFDALGTESEVTRLTSFPTVWSIFNGFDHIYWDNDLGEGVDVVKKLTELYWSDPDMFSALFQHKRHIVHSANTIANERIVSLLRSIGAKAESQPITAWKQRSA